MPTARLPIDVWTSMNRSRGSLRERGPMWPVTDQWQHRQWWHGDPHPWWTEWQTNTTENITFLADGNNEKSSHYTKTLLEKSRLDIQALKSMYEHAQRIWTNFLHIFVLCISCSHTYFHYFRNARTDYGGFFRWNANEQQNLWMKTIWNQGLPLLLFWLPFQYIFLKKTELQLFLISKYDHTQNNLTASALQNFAYNNPMWSCPNVNPGDLLLGSVRKQCEYLADPM